MSLACMVFVETYLTTVDMPFYDYSKALARCQGQSDPEEECEFPRPQNVSTQFGLLQMIYIYIPDSTFLELKPTFKFTVTRKQ